MHVQVRVDHLEVDEVTETPVVWLRSLDGKRVVPISVGILDATAIALHLHGDGTSRLSHYELLLRSLHAAGADLRRVALDRADESGPSATLWFDTAHGRTAVRSRPADAIALALMTGVPIEADDSMLRVPEHLELTAVPGAEVLRRAQRLAALAPEACTRYRM